MVAESPAREKGTAVTHENDGSVTFEGNVDEATRRKAFEDANAGKSTKAERADVPKPLPPKAQEQQAEHDAAEAAAAAGPVTADPS